ncbi:E3 ubiquitin-protein ligase RDUF2 [Cardamine amara subsp. amara]|uniref:E3 ubiquitin-protein ligase RDUF2 n=1 Tax=Cardamine amara subsp. amara TaxID=228776 RepID=A0ABD1B9W2_CARAN
MIAILDHEIVSNPQPEDVGTITVTATVEGYDPTFTAKTFLEEFIEVESRSKENLNDFLMESGINDDDTADGIIELMTYISEVTSSASTDYFPGCALKVGLFLVYGDHQIEEAVQVSLDDHQIEEAVQASFQESYIIRFRPASMFVVEDLPREIYDKPSDTDENCTICLDEFDNGERVVTLPCDHYFHDECAVTWLETSHLCPLCRFELPCEDQ